MYNNTYTYIPQNTDILFNNIITYIIFLSNICIILQLKSISMSFSELTKYYTNISILYNKSEQLQRDIKQIKSKSLDNIDINHVLTHRSNNIENEINIIKYKQKLQSDELNELKKNIFV